MNKCLVEFLGTFFLVFTIGNVVVEPKLGNFAPIAIGSVLIGLIYAGAHLSGAHCNPAVAVGFITMGITSLHHIWIFMLETFLVV